MRSPRIFMRDIEEVQIHNGEIDFINKSGIIYRVYSQGVNHVLISPEGDASMSFDIDQ